MNWLKKLPHSLLLWAVRAGPVGLAAPLMRWAGTDGVALLHEAAESGNLKLAEFALPMAPEYGETETPITGDDRFWIDPCWIEYNALHSAARSGHQSILEFLLDNGADVDCAGLPCSPLKVAADEGQLEIVKYLLSRGADLNRGRPVEAAIDKGHEDIARLLLERGVEVEFTVETDSLPGAAGNSLLHMAANRNLPEIAEMLILVGLDVNAAEGEYDQTPLMAAASTANLDLVKRLVEAGARVNAKDRFGVTAVEAAAGSGSLEVVDYLIECGADFDSGDIETPIFEAVKYGYLELTKLLLEKGANVNRQGSGKSTLLHYAAENRNPEMIKLLLEFGARKDLEDNYGATPHHYGQDELPWDVVEMLRPD